jgi:hypothetical protein
MDSSCPFAAALSSWAKLFSYTSPSNADNASKNNTSPLFCASRALQKEKKQKQKEKKKKESLTHLPPPNKVRQNPLKQWANTLNLPLRSLPHRHPEHKHLLKKKKKK